MKQLISQLNDKKLKIIELANTSSLNVIMTDKE